MSLFIKQFTLKLIFRNETNQNKYSFHPHEANFEVITRVLYHHFQSTDWLIDRKNGRLAYLNIKEMINIEA